MQRWKRRVDLQVSLLTAAVVFLSSSVVFFFCFTYTYAGMISELKERVHAIVSFANTSLDPLTFTEIHDRGDMTSPLYQQTAQLLRDIRSATGVRYLYTATVTENDTLIYLLDGLEPESEDFRYPGDLIEPEIQQDLRTALAGTEILPNTIKATDWGKIFIAYSPVYQDDAVIGVVGVEFDAGRQAEIYHQLRNSIPLTLIFACGLTTVIAFFVFRRISNPHYKDLAITDQLTQMRNRNAFEVDIGNLNASHQFKKMGILVADLDHLKQVNDELGHIQGDLYIQKAAAILQECLKPQAVLYRTGGDEFAALILDTSGRKDLSDLCTQLRALYKKHRPDWPVETGLSVGWAVYEIGDQSVEDIYRRADNAMYQDKAAAHQQ